ncbi:OmpP1/FadL family transporter [Hydrocarboniphaga sp.]|uniref:OmpP1/FadL family transporter n=1 Tax=Hydrocarboniphaga sp. TaxID=2033016 RepID=UPI003D151AA1
MSGIVTGPIRARRALALCVSVAALLLCAGKARADGFHYRNLMVGDRAIGFGGAYVALADDTAGLFYNPAGAPYSKELAAATVNVLSRSQVQYQDFFPDGGSLHSTSSGLVPSYFGIMRVSEACACAFGFSIAVNDFLSERQLDDSQFLTPGGSVDEYLSGDVDRRLYNVGPSFGMKLGNSGWSWGVTLYGSYRDMRESRTIGGKATRATQDGATERLNVQTSYRIEDTQLGARPVLGLQYRGNSVSFGAVVARDFGFRRDYRYFYRSSRNLVTQNDDGSNKPEAVLDIEADSRSPARQHYPWQTSIGAALQPYRQWFLSAQVDHYFKVDQGAVASGSADSPPVTRQFKAVDNFSLGSEYVASPQVSLRAAVYTDYSNADVADAGVFERRESIDLVGFSLGGTYRDNTREYKLGFYYSRGDGKGTLGDLGELNFSGASVVDARASNLTLLFGAEL